jgi:hypothetical protein
VTVASWAFEKELQMADWTVEQKVSSRADMLVYLMADLKAFYLVVKRDAKKDQRMVVL